MDTISQVAIFSVSAGVGLWIGTKIFDSPLNGAIAGAVAIAAELAELIPTVGFAASMIVMIAGVKFATRCDLTEAFISALIARVAVLVAVFVWKLGFT